MSGHTAAFFDVDGTLVSGNCTKSFIQHLFDQEIIPLPAMGDFYQAYERYHLGEGDYLDLVMEAARLLRGLKEVKVKEEARSCFDKTVKPLLDQEMIRLLDSHREQDRKVILATASVGYIADEIGRYLEVEFVIATRLKPEDGIITERVLEPVSWGKGKAKRVSDFAREKGIALGDSYFYTNDMSDLPLLEIVGHPNYVNPGPEDLKLITEKGWGHIARL